MTGTTLGRSGDEAPQEAPSAPDELVDYVSVWADEATEVIGARGAPPFAKVRGDRSLAFSGIQPRHGRAFFAQWTNVQGGHELDTRPVLVKKRTIRHRESNLRDLADQRRRAVENDERWRIEIRQLTGPVLRIDEVIVRHAEQTGTPRELHGQLPRLVGYWIDEEAGLSEDEHARRGQEAPSVCVALSRLHGRTLREVVGEARGRLDPGDAAAVVEAAARTLQYVHDAGYWYADVSENNLLARQVLADSNGDRRWVVDLCDVEHLTPQKPGLDEGNTWGGTRPFATVMSIDNRASYESDLTNLAYRAYLLYFGTAPDGSCPTEPPADDRGLPTPLLGLLRRAARSSELRRANERGTGPAQELMTIAAFGTWVRNLTPKPDEDAFGYIQRVHRATTITPVSRQVNRDLVAWAMGRNPLDSPNAVALGVKLALAESGAATDRDGAERLRSDAALRLAQLAEVQLPEWLRDALDQVELDPTRVEEDIPNRYAEGLARLVEAYPDADWRTPAARAALAAITNGDDPPTDDADGGDDEKDEMLAPDTRATPTSRGGADKTDNGQPGSTTGIDEAANLRLDSPHRGWRHRVRPVGWVLLIVVGLAALVLGLTMGAVVLSAKSYADVTLNYVRGDKPVDSTESLCSPGHHGECAAWAIHSDGSMRTTYGTEAAADVTTLAGGLHLSDGDDDCQDATIHWQISVGGNVADEGTLDHDHPSADLTELSPPSARTTDELVLTTRRTDEADCAVTFEWWDPGYETPGLFPGWPWE